MLNYALLDMEVMHKRKSHNILLKLNVVGEHTH